MRAISFSRFLRHFALAAAFCGAATTHAQWISQTNLLNPGWNAVFLEVEPQDPESDQVFANVPIEGVWQWSRQAGQPQFVVNVAEVLPKNPDWAVHYPANHPQRPLRNLFEVQGGQALLIQLKGSSPVPWIVTGRPVLPKASWVPDVPNLRGFHVSETSPPTFQSFLFNSPRHDGTNVYFLNAAGRWTPTNGNARIERGRAYWVQNLGGASFSGPTSVDPESGGGLDYGDTVAERRLVLRNEMTNSTRIVTIALQASGSKPSQRTNGTANAGLPTLAYWDVSLVNATNLHLGWKNLEGPLSVTLAPGQEHSLRFAVRRRDFPAPTQADSSSEYQGVLAVTDDLGSKVLVPVTAQGLEGGASSARAARLSSSVAPHNAVESRLAGLWVGIVTVTNVNWVGAPSTNIVQANPAFNLVDRTTPRPTSSEFQFRVLVHLDGTGTARLLPKVLEVWSDGTRVPDPLNPGLFLPGTPGQFRLFTDETAAASFSGSTLRDGKPVARRLSTPIFALRDPVVMTKAGVFGSGTLGCAVVTGHDDALNPFKHAYHPDHDNWNARYDAKLPAGIEAYEIRRALELRFSEAHPSGINPPAWQDTELGGTYAETIQGLHREPLRVAGSFVIRRVSPVSTLN